MMPESDSPPKKPLVLLEKVMKRFGEEAQPALASIDLTIPPGEMFAIAGPDGSGKTTLMRLIAGLLLPTEGNVMLAGFNSKKDPYAFADEIGYMPQKFGLYEDLSVMQNLKLYAKLRGLPKNEQKETFDNLLKMTSLKPYPDRLAGNLSGGMKQKLGLACALLRKPQLLILDEPTVGVDPVSRQELWKLVQDMRQEGISVLWSTAYLEDVEKCDRVLLLDEGKVQFLGQPQELTKRVDGRVFLHPIPQENRYAFLKEITKNLKVCDKVIQGADLRVVVKKTSPLPTAPPWKPTSPRFEDAFIDLLGGTPPEESALDSREASLPSFKDLAIKAERLTKRFGSFTAADKISLEIKQGEIFGLLGPNGAGKSTTFKMLCGLLKPNEGTAYIAGMSIKDQPIQVHMQMGYMAQKFSLYDSLTVHQNLTFFSGVYNLKGKEQLDAIQEMIELFHFIPYLNIKSRLLPLGYKQRLALACSLMHHPAILFLDEPTSGVDPLTRREFWNHMMALVQKGVTVLVTTHFMDEAEYCDRIGLIYRSHMILVDTPDGLKKSAQQEGEPLPTLETAFIHHIQAYDHEHPL